MKSSKLYSLIINHKWLGIASLLTIVYLLPYYILGSDTHIRIHDNMDSTMVWYKLLAESGQIFTLTDVELPNAINGLPRSTLPSGLDATLWMYLLFKPMTVYIINQTLMRFVALFGMYLLLKKHVFRTSVSPMIIAGVALGFAILPFWPPGLLSIAGLPLALHIFLTIRKRQKETPLYFWIIIGLYPFFSNFILTFVFFLGIMGVLWLVDWIRYKKSNWIFFSSIAMMTTIYLIKNYLLIYTMFFSSSFTSQRSEANLGHKDFPDTLDLFMKNIIDGHTHDLSIHATVILPIIGVAILIALLRGMVPKLLLGLLLINVALSFWYALWYWQGMRVVKDNILFFNMFNMSRIHFFQPIIWYICFALALIIIWKYVKFGHILAVAVLIAQLYILFSLNEEKKYSDLNMLTYNEFYSVELFDEIKEYIGKDPASYRVVNVAMHPAIAQYNGFYTLDTYNNSFPLEYKHAFKKIIAPELEKSPKLEHYFDTWGGRLYMYSSELGKHYRFYKTSDKTIEEYQMNTDAFQELGGDYVFSALPIENAEDTGLDLEKTFENEQSPWRIYLYSVDE